MADIDTDVKDQADEAVPEDALDESALDDISGGVTPHASDE